MRVKKNKVFKQLSVIKMEYITSEFYMIGKLKTSLVNGSN